MKKLFLSIVLISLMMASYGKQTIFDIKEYGAIGDGLTLNTLAIQKTIDSCSKSGGGIVRISAGSFVTGTIEIKSDVTISNV